MAKVSDVYLAVTINGLVFFTRKSIDEQTRHMVRMSWPVADMDVPEAAMRCQWDEFVSAATPSEWKH